MTKLTPTASPANITPTAIQAMTDVFAARPLIHDSGDSGIPESLGLWSLGLERRPPHLKGPWPMQSLLCSPRISKKSSLCERRACFGPVVYAADFSVAR